MKRLTGVINPEIVPYTLAYPRFELVEECRVVSKDKSFLMITFAELLAQFGAPPTVVEEVRQEEVSASAAITAYVGPGSTLGAQVVSLTANSLRRHLKTKYPSRLHFASPDKYVKLFNELKRVGIHSVEVLDQWLEEAESELLAEEEGQVGSGLDVYADVGAVRVSLRLAGLEI